MLKPDIPEVLEEGAQLREALRPDAIEPPGSQATFAEKTVTAQDSQMLGNRRTSDVEITGDVAGGHLALTNEMENRKPGWIPHRLDCAKNRHVINFLLVCLYERLYLRYKVVYAMKDIAIVSMTGGPKRGCRAGAESLGRYHSPPV